MSSFIVIPYIKVQAANFQNSGILMGGAPLFATAMFCHALARQLKVTDLGFHYIHHNIQRLGSEAYGRFTPAQRRGAVFIGKSDYSSKNKNALSLQPTASCHILASLIVHVDEDNDEYKTKDIQSFLSRGRLAGGQILETGKIKICDALGTALKHVGTGFLVLDRQDLLVRYQQEYKVDRLTAFTQLLAHKAAKKDEQIKPVLDLIPEENLNWISATTLGYTLLEPLNTERTGVRQADHQEQTPHALAEPLTGLIQYQSLHEILNDYILENPKKWESLKRLEWSSHWISEDTFLLQQPHTQG